MPVVPPSCPNIGQVTERHLEGHRHPVEAVDRDRLSTALDLADELAAESGSFAKPFLAERALFAQGAEALAEEFSDVFDGALCHGTVILLVVVTLNTFPWFGNRSRALRVFRVFPDALGGARRGPKSQESEVRTRETSQGRSISTAEPLTRTG
jgi:hypothetical protein